MIGKALKTQRDLVMNELKYYLPVFVILFMPIGMLIMSKISGWERLSNRYSGDDRIRTIIKSFKWQTMKLNQLGNYNNCINFNIHEEGLSLKPSLLFSLFHNRIFIHWSDIKDIEHLKKPFTGIRLIGEDFKIMIFGKLSSEVTNQFSKNDPKNISKETS